jgi:hypothetical protein
MSDVKDRPVQVTVNGQEYEIVFNLNVWENILEVYSTPFALMRDLLGKDGQRAKAVKTALAALLAEAVDIHNESAEKKLKAPTKTQLGRMLSLADMPAMARIILEALHRSLPEPESKTDTEMSEDPKN